MSASVVGSSCVPSRSGALKIGGGGNSSHAGSLVARTHIATVPTSTAAETAKSTCVCDA